MKTQKRTKERRVRFGYTRMIVPRPKFEEMIASQLYPDEFDDVMTAYQQAKHGHKDQTRRDQMTRYFDHCKGVALIMTMECNVFLGKPIIGGLLHDIKEDSFILTWKNVLKLFGKDVYRCLRIVTKERGKDYYRGIKNVQARDWWIIFVKLSDRLHNMRTLLHQDEAFMRKQLEETERIYPELIDVLEAKAPKRFKYLAKFFRDELKYACNKVRKSIGLPRTTAF